MGLSFRLWRGDILHSNSEMMKLLKQIKRTFSSKRLIDWKTENKKNAHLNSTRSHIRFFVSSQHWVHNITMFSRTYIFLLLISLLLIKCCCFGMPFTIWFINCLRGIEMKDSYIHAYVVVVNFSSFEIYFAITNFPSPPSLLSILQRQLQFRFLWKYIFSKLWSTNQFPTQYGKELFFNILWENQKTSHRLSWIWREFFFTLAIFGPCIDTLAKTTTNENYNDKDSLYVHKSH